MTATVNANTTTGVVVTSDTSGALALQTGGTTALTVTSAQLVGIGTSSPSSALDVATSNSGITLTNTAVSNKQWRLGGNSSGYFQITETGVADRLLIDTSGNLKLITGGAKILNSSGNPILQQTGSVLQVVQGTSTTQATTTSGNWDSTGLTASITPTSSTSKVLIFVSGGMEGNAGGSANQKLGFKIYRGASSIESSSNGKVFYSVADSYIPINFITLDSPATTSSTAYTLYFNRLAGNTTASFCRDSAETTNIILMEIAA